MQCTHLKRWTVPGVIRTDLFCRAVPWTRLLLSHPKAEADLNLGRGEPARAALAGALAVSLVLAVAGLAPPWLPPALFAAAVLANRPLFRVFRRRGGWLFGLGAMAFHQLYYLYSAAVYAYCWTEHRLGGGRTASSRGPGGAER